MGIPVVLITAGSASLKFGADAVEISNGPCISVSGSAVPVRVISMNETPMVADYTSRLTKEMVRRPPMDDHRTHGAISTAPPTPTKAGVIYTCAMHPQVRQVGPGNCPICGMTLEPIAVTGDVGPNRELKDMTRRFWVAVVLTLPVFVLEMGGHIPALGLHNLVSPRVSTWIQFALSTPVVLWAGWPFFQRAWASVSHRSLNMFSLIALGTGAAYIYSLFATFAPGLFPAGFRGMGGTVSVYFEAAAVITVLVLLGQVLELRAREQTGGAIRALLKLAPKTAHRLKDGGEDEEVALDLIQVGDRLRVRPGDGVPVDGEVLEGKGAVDESMVTGESMPAAKQPGDKLIGGTVNGTGSLVMRADKIGADTMLSRIVAMVGEAQRSRAPIQRMADTVSGYFVPAVLGVAVIAFSMRDLLVGVFPGLEACLDLKTKGPLHLLTRFVTPAELRAAGKKRLVRHLQAAGGLPKVEDLADRALAVAAEQTIAVPAERMTARLIRELANEALASRTRLIELDRELETLLQRHPDAALIRSLPGMGAVLTAELIAEAGNLARFRSADALASAAGMAPVLRQSGRTRFLRRPSGGNKGLKRVFYQSAFCSLNHDDSRAFYERKRREGKRHHQAVIALARRRVNVLWAVLNSRTPFQSGFKATP